MSGTTYAQAGVSIDAQDRAIALFREAVRSTYRAEVISDVGAFGGLFAYTGAGLARPALVASIDSVGTKVLLAARCGRHRGIGHDIVNHCVNDIAVMGAEPLFFLDYYATPKLDPEAAAEVVGGVCEACRAVGCAVLGGELAELPGVYQPDTYDLAGVVVGVVDRDRVLDPATVEVGDAVIGLPSTGLHTNGYSLARRVLLEDAGLKLEEEIAPGGPTLAEALLAVHRCYLPALRALRQIGLPKVAAHITGGGVRDNLPRVLPAGCGAVLRRGAWPEPPIFGLIQRLGQVADDELFRTLNMGLGMLVVVAAERANEALAACAAAGCAGWQVGAVTSGSGVVIE